MSSTIDEHEEPGRRQITSWMIITSVILMLLGVAGIVTTGVFLSHERSFIECQAELNDVVQANLKERSQAGDLDRSALRLLAKSGSVAIGIVLDPNKSEDEKRGAIQTWANSQKTAEDQLADADTKRAEHPLPTPRRC